MVRSIYSEAPKASEQCGYNVPPELGVVSLICETNAHNSCSHCEGGMASGRSSGYFSLTAPAWARFAPKCGVWCPKRKPGEEYDEWSKRVCWYAFRNPDEQVRVYWCLIAYYLHQENGDVNRTLAIYFNGTPEATDYTWMCHEVWRHHWEWPKDGKLTPLEPADTLNTWKPSPGSK